MPYPLHPPPLVLWKTISLVPEATAEGMLRTGVAVETPDRLSDRYACRSWCCESGRCRTTARTRLFHNTRVAPCHCQRDARITGDDNHSACAD
ncbi:hypothetical protein AAFF_G00421160 [Aldrovandia affinis]|uniref:Uncharacterized protein n=1 Tax=Aldrovandia affinis TaxID=143900 RepID=A0AAD7SA03_9TELE|nr:hypothetical protein AAFF_G00421160 [Aldrovandia affinis]